MPAPSTGIIVSGIIVNSILAILAIVILAVPMFEVRCVIDNSQFEFYVDGVSNSARGFDKESYDSPSLAVFPFIDDDKDAANGVLAVSVILLMFTCLGAGVGGCALCNAVPKSAVFVANNIVGVIAIILSIIAATLIGGTNSSDEEHWRLTNPCLVGDLNEYSGGFSSWAAIIFSIVVLSIAGSSCCCNCARDSTTTAVVAAAVSQ